ncbi:MAG TPA: hypothetical protein VG939_00155 [Caulobacteraceae bacterium]|nr:hypothetical protein [Caulobacteraceae bacterium]
MSVIVGAGDAYEDRVRDFQPGEGRLALSVLGLVALTAVFGLVFGLGSGGDAGAFPLLLFLAPIAAQALSCLYVKTVKVRIDKDTFRKS